MCVRRISVNSWYVRVATSYRLDFNYNFIKKHAFKDIFLLQGGHNYPGDDMPGGTCVSCECNCLDGVKTSAIDQNIGSSDLPVNPTSPSAAEAASDELNSGGIIAEEQQLLGASCPLKKARTE